MNGKLIALEQGTSEWLDFRKSKLGASDIPALMNLKGAYKTRAQLLQEKLTGETKELSDFTKKMFSDGHEWEVVVRDSVSNLYGKFTPCVVQSIENENYFASLDGLQESNLILEIKSTVNKTILSQVEMGVCPDAYNYQIQWQLYCTGLNECLLAVVDRNTGAVETLTIERDDSLIDKIKTAAAAFMEELNGGVVPYQQLQNETLAYIANSKKIIKEYQALIDAEEDKIKAMAEKLLTDFNALKIEGCGVKIEHQERKGSVDYSAIPELKNVDLEKFRKPGTRFVKITETKTKGNDNEQLSDN